LDDIPEKNWMVYGQAQDGGVEAIEAGCDVRRLAERMPPVFALALSRIADGEPKTMIVAEVGIDLFALEQRIARFRREMRLAAKLKARGSTSADKPAVRRVNAEAPP
jgi:hypothetical protein